MTSSVEYRSAGLGALFSSARSLHLDSEGLRYTAHGQVLELKWSQVLALVPAAAPVAHDAHDVDMVPAIGIVLRDSPNAPVLVDGVLPNLDHAIPVLDLGRRPLLGLSARPEDIVRRAAELAEAAGVKILGLPAPQSR